MSTPLAKVEFEFQSEGDPGTAWQVVALNAFESLSEIYTVTLEVATADLSADPDRMLGMSGRVLMTRDGQGRAFLGIAHRVEHKGVVSRHKLARVELVPALHALSLVQDSKIFQDMKVPDILRAVLSEGLKPYGRAVRLELQRDYPVREYCVQYRETTLEFVRRLMGEEGIAFHFDHTGSEEALVLTDSNAPFHTVATAPGPVMVAGTEAGTHAMETIRHFDRRDAMQSTSSVVRDYDWTQPRLDLTREARGRDAQGLDREVYEYPPALTITDYRNPRYTREDGAAQAKIRRELFRAKERRFSGLGYVTGFVPGSRFTLTGHGEADQDGEYVLVGVEHSARCPEVLTGDVADALSEEDRYHNRFECMRFDTVFRPARPTKRPTINGIQTAAVVGPPGEEIYPDEHGRIKVQFHWDRVGQHDERSSCWIRCAQNWAGSGWGFVFIPRVGMEVVVQFLEGDPDRPIVTGSVYNGQNAPPYPLPAEKTKSTIKTLSSPGGNGYNELRFEDRAGAEEIFVHAQLDYHTHTERDVGVNTGRDHAGSVGRNEDVTVGNNRTAAVGVDESTNVGNNQSLTVGTNQTTGVGSNQTLSVGANQDTTVGANQSLSVGANQTISVTGNRTVSVTGNESVSVTGNQTISVTGNRSTSVTGNEDHTITGNLNTSVTGNEDRTVTGNQTVSVTGNGQRSVTGNDVVTVEGNLILNAMANLEAKADADLKLGADANVEVHAGSIVSVMGGSQVVVQVGGSTITITSGSIDVTSPTVNVSGAGMVNVTGGVIKLNA